jgi:hypothetical protein
MGNMGFLGSICTSFSDGDLISPVSGVNECNPGTIEQTFEKRFEIRSGQITFDQFDIRQRGQFFRYQAFVGSHLGPNMPADSTSDADEGRTLPSSRVDRCNDFFGHYKNLIGKDSRWWRNAGRKFFLELAFGSGSAGLV